ncbi:LpxI family protein [bacterium]|nr:LpxI family protein [bacterium]MBU1599684.1 LpxI family protein [bacterium]MBU2461452.1 LpxI family protein [bacterium]
MKKIAIVSAGGEIAQALIKEIGDARVYEIDPQNPPDLPEFAERLQEDGMTDVVFSGKVDKRAVFSSKINFAKKDDISILKDISFYFTTRGIKVRSQLRWLKRFLTKEGVITGRMSEAFDMNIKFGFGIAKRLVRLGIGQTVCVKNGIVVAIESLEGTDETILRAGSLVQDFVVFKGGKNGLELPVIGKKTILAMKKAGAKALGLQANRVLLLPSAVGLAKKEGISIVGL